MNADGSLRVWRVLYEAAILENDEERLVEKITAAKSAICDRVEDLHTTGDPERVALQRAWNALHALEEIHLSGPASRRQIGSAA